MAIGTTRKTLGIADANPVPEAAVILAAMSGAACGGALLHVFPLLQLPQAGIGAMTAQQYHVVAEFHHAALF
jgi:hypothetical protein